MKKKWLNWTLHLLVFVSLMQVTPVSAQSESVQLKWYLHLPTNSLLFEESQNDVKENVLYPLFHKSVPIQTSDATVSLYNMEYASVNNPEIKANRKNIILYLL